MDATFNEPKSFLKHVFNFNEESKHDIMNLNQYALIALGPVVALNKLVQQYVPDADEDKSSGELLAEVVMQLVGMFMGMLIIHRIVTYIPTFSEEPYPEYNLMFSVLPTMFITISLQTKMGEKIRILLERSGHLWFGTSPESSEKTAPVKRAPVAGGMLNQQQHQPSDGTSLDSLPPPRMQQPPPAQQQGGGGGGTDYDGMYQQNPTPMVGADTPGNEPVAMTEFGGFGGFSSW